MTRFLAVVLSLAFAAHLRAGTADLRVTMAGPDRVDPGKTFSGSVTVENAGPDAAPKIQVIGSAYPEVQ